MPACGRSRREACHGNCPIDCFRYGFKYRNAIDKQAFGIMPEYANMPFSDDRVFKQT
jgi:hypothetical protein